MNVTTILQPTTMAACPLKIHTQICHNRKPLDFLKIVPAILVRSGIAIGIIHESRWYLSFKKVAVQLVTATDWLDL